MNFLFLINILGKLKAIDQDYDMSLEKDDSFKSGRNWRVFYAVYLAVVSSYSGFNARNPDMMKIRALLKRSFADQFRNISLN